MEMDSLLTLGHLSPPSSLTLSDPILALLSLSRTPGPQHCFLTLHALLGTHWSLRPGHLESIPPVLACPQAAFLWAPLALPPSVPVIEQTSHISTPDAPITVSFPQKTSFQPVSCFEFEK